MRSSSFHLLMITVGVGVVACGDIGSAGPLTGGGGNQGAGGAANGGVTTAEPPGTGGAVSSTSQTPASGGNDDAGSSSANGGSNSSTSGNKTGGAAPTGGAAATGGKTSATGGAALGGSATGGRVSTGGVASGGFGFAMGGSKASGGGASTGGASPTVGGGTSVSTSTSMTPLDCSAAMPTGGTQKCLPQNTQGTAGGLTWTLWSNKNTGCITTFSTPAFSASWTESGDYLARIGLQWNNTKTYDQYGTITAQFAYKKTGTGGGYSYIGIYGWSTNPCVEYYIVDDSFNGMPVNPGNTTNKGTVDIDGGTYILYSRNTTGTGGSKCTGVTSWIQYYSVRKTARQCGEISITKHFDAWKAAGMTLGKMDQAQILVEVGGGTGSADFSTANVTSTQ